MNTDVSSEQWSDQRSTAAHKRRELLSSGSLKKKTRNQSSKRAKGTHARKYAGRAYGHISE
jgi:hypothetical protein